MIKKVLMWIFQDEIVQDDERLVDTSRKSIKGKRAPKYDAEAIKNDLRKGIEAKHVAHDHQVSLPTVYKLRRELEVQGKA